ncbi:hypothetical protein [uncultured Tateyamaria sp.]|uniref:hypothetical protein n=1 Tax=Tateyamaria sp. 1078 TaxID=3417464 RepID=UPI002603023F|nr:hypothetical protein [uncultured Tateyamaria sp.]
MPVSRARATLARMVRGLRKRTGATVPETGDNGAPAASHLPGDVVQAAWQMAGNGQQAEAVQHLLDHADQPPGDAQLAPICHIAAVHGQQARVVDLAMAYLKRVRDSGQGHKPTTVWTLEVLRRAKHFGPFADGCLHLRGRQISHPKFYAHLAAALHDQEFLNRFRDDPRLERLFALSLAQTHASAPGARMEFAHKNALLHISARHAYAALLPLHRALALAVQDDLPPTRNVVLTRLQLGLGDGIPSQALLDAISSATPAEIYAIWTLHASDTTDLMQLLYIDGSFDRAVAAFPPQVILTLEKIYQGQSNTALRLIVDAWVDTIPDRYADTAPADLPCEVLDQLVLSQRSVRPALYDWYLARRPEADRLTGLSVLAPVERPPAPALSLECRPRIGVCISGQLRGYTQAWPLIRHHLLRDVEPVIFVDTWRKIGRKAPTPAQAWRMFGGSFLKTYQDVGHSMGFLALQARYPRLTALDDANCVTAHQLAAFYDCPEDHVRIEDDGAGAFAAFSNPQKMYHKIRGAQSMLDASGIEVDAVLRIRPDKGLEARNQTFDWRNMIHASATQNTFFADFPARPHPTFGFVIGDQAGIATPALMRIYARAADTTVEAGTLGWIDWPATPQPHLNLSHALWINGVRIDNMPVRWSRMYDPEALTPAAVLALLEHDLEGRAFDSSDTRLLAAARADVENAG